MAEIALPVVVTAIANSEVEGFVAGTLFSQGWNVVFRALDFESLRGFIEADSQLSRNVVVIYSPDLQGVTAELIGAIQGKVRQVVGFASGKSTDADFTGLFSVPQEVPELLSLMRGFVRAPMIRSAALTRTVARRARVIAIGSPSGAAGCTTLAINLAMELSAIGKETFLMDADVRHPSIAAMLSLHKLDAEQSSRTISPHLNVSEFTRDRLSQMPEYLDEVVTRNDFVILDLGSIGGISDSLTDRRWTSTMVHWSCEQADDLWLVSKADVIAIQRLESLVRELSRATIRARLSLALNMKVKGKKAKLREDQFSTAIAPLHAHGIFHLPNDLRAISNAEEERATLLETDDRSVLRKCIAKMAVELTA